MVKKVNPYLPKSRAAAIECLGVICDLRRRSDVLQTALDRRIAQATQQIGCAREPLEEEIKLRLKGLAKWAEANRDFLLADGDARSVAFATGTIGWRWGNPTVVIEKDAEDAVIRQLKKHRLNRFLRFKVEIAKDVILAAGADAIRRISGISIKQKEIFFAEPLDVPAAESASQRLETGTTRGDNA